MVLQGQGGIPKFTDGFKLGGSIGTGVFCRVTGLELYFKFNDDCSVFQVEIFANLKAIEAISGSLASGSESYVIFVDS